MDSSNLEMNAKRKRSNQEPVQWKIMTEKSKNMKRIAHETQSIERIAHESKRIEAIPRESQKLARHIS
jgi:hypothetical protein